MEALLFALLIFSLRVVNNAMGTVRVIVMTGGRRWLSFGLAFLESLIFAFTAGNVLTDLNNLPNLIAYAGGFAVGNYVGMVLEQRFVIGFMTINIISIDQGAEIAVRLREAGLASPAPRARAPGAA
ncbi:MAG: hypothetical protein HC915_17310 [Anaerolineae bacterium]|nr:hypothetical protein [Anaerolineae bacterium]